MVATILMIFLRVLSKIILWPHYSGPQELGSPGSLNRLKLTPGSYATDINNVRQMGWRSFGMPTSCSNGTCIPSRFSAVSQQDFVAIIVALMNGVPSYGVHNGIANEETPLTVPFFVLNIRLFTATNCSRFACFK